MEKLLGLLRIRVRRGVELAIRDVCISTSDPYVVIQMGTKKLKTTVIKKNINPEWNDELTLSVEDANLPIKLTVYDKDTLSFDDEMGDAEFDIKALMEAVNMGLSDLPNGTIITKVLPSRQNCLAEESRIMWDNGKVVQEMCLKLRNTESGEIELDLQWIDLPKFCVLEGKNSVHATS